jgi:hypothetical protein
LTAFRSKVVTVTSCASSTRSGNAAETKQVGQAALRVLTAKGYDPQDKWLALFVYAREHLSSTDGTRFARELGKARYDRDTNTLNFEPYRPPIRTRR